MRILLPVDGSSFSKAAVAFIASRDALIQSQPDIELINVQHAVPPRAARAAGKELVFGYYKSEADKAVRPALAQLKRAGLQARVNCIVGNPGEEVSKIAAAEAADLIVMGSHGHTGLKRLLFGSVTSTVLASSTIPLLVLRDDAIAKKDSLKVGIALDGSKYGIAAVKYFIEHLDLFGKSPTVTLMHVVPDLSKLVVPGVSGDEPVLGFKPEQVEAMHGAAFERAMAPARKLLERTQVQVAEARLIGNNAGDEIAAYATKNELDLVVMGSHGDGFLESAALGSVAMRVAAQCRFPLLFIREK